MDQPLHRLWELLALDEEQVPHAGSPDLGAVSDDALVATLVLQLPIVNVLVRGVERSGGVVGHYGPGAVVVPVPAAADLLPDQFQLHDQAVAPGAQLAHHCPQLADVLADCVLDVLGQHGLREDLVGDLLEVTEAFWAALDAHHGLLLFAEDGGHLVDLLLAVFPPGPSFHQQALILGRFRLSPISQAASLQQRMRGLQRSLEGTRAVIAVAASFVCRVRLLGDHRGHGSAGMDPRAVRGMGKK